MSDTAFSLEDLDPDMREEAEARAAESGQSVADYVADRLLQSLLADAAMAPAANEFSEPEVEVLGDEPIVDVEPAPAGGREAHVFRQRLDALERRLSLAFGGFDTGFEGLRGSLSALSARLDDSEVREEDFGARVGGALEALRASIDALDARMGEAQGRAEAAEIAHAAARGELMDRVDLALADLRTSIDAMDADAAEMGRAHEALRADLLAQGEAAGQRMARLEQAVRSADSVALGAHQAVDHLATRLDNEVSAVAADAMRRLTAQEHQMRAALQSVAEAAEGAAADAIRQADAAAARALAEVRACRETLEQQVIAGVASAHARVDQTLAHTSKLYDALAERIGDGERATARAFDALRTDVADLQNNTRAAIAELSRGMDNALAGQNLEFERFTEAQRVATQTLEATLSDEIGELRERHLGSAARLKLFDAAMADVAAEIADIRAALDQRMDGAAAALDARAAAAEAQLSARIDALASELDELGREARDARAATSAETAGARREIGEALEAVVQRQQTDLVALRQDADALAQQLRDEFAEMRAGLDESAQDVRAQQKGALARLKLIEEGLDAQARATQTADQRLLALNERVSRAELEFAAMGSARQGVLEQLGDRLDMLEAAGEAPRLSGGVLQRVEDLAARLAAHETEAAEAAERSGNLARLISKLSAQYTDASTQAQERLHKIEVALADLRLQRPPLDLAELHRWQAQITVELRAEMAHAFEQVAAQDNDAVHALRDALEDRIVAVERRSVAALEQLSEIVALLGKRNTPTMPEAQAQSA